MSGLVGWIWPISWWLRIKNLEIDNTILRAQLKELENKYVASEISHALTLNGLMQTMIQSSQDHIAELQRRQQRIHEFHREIEELSKPQP